MMRPAIGIIGATVMPHSIFLGSTLATQDRITKSKLSRIESRQTADSEATAALSVWRMPTFLQAVRRVRSGFASTFRIVPIEEYASEPKTHADHENNSYTFVRAHIYHGMVDIAVSLLGIAVVINAL